MLRVIQASLALILCSFTLSATQPEIIKLIPPKITKETISEKIGCIRPMREGKFNISLEHTFNKTIVNCYGHGGSGWTTLFGSVNKAIELFEQTNPSKDIPIRIIGSGCMGLTAAIELKRLGYQVAGISTKNLYDIPSWKAAGYFALVSVKTSPEEQDALNEIGLNTFLTYQNIDSGNHPYISKEAVRFMPVYCSIDTDAGVEDLEARGMIPPRQYVSLDFGSGVIHSDYVKYMTYFMNTTTLMRQLQEELKRLEVGTEIQKVTSFNDIAEEVIFNCSGLGGRELNTDEAMIAVRGHLITLNETSGTEHMDYMIYTKVMQDGKEEYIYMFPKNISVTLEQVEGTSCMGVLGGTFIPHFDQLPLSQQEALDSLEFQKILDRNCEFFHGKTFNN